ncbi:MAG: DNA polymerase IV [Nocardioidaceae bacterium]
MRTEATILHLDLDAFFASVEQRDKPSLRGRPVIVGGVGPRGVVSTASYEARRFGVRSAMSTAEARSRCPQAAFLSPRFTAYRLTSDVVMARMAQISHLVEPLSLDEAFVDLAAGQPASHDLRVVTDIAAQLRGDVESLTGGLTCSVGIATSKLVAKIASELDKPDGCIAVPPGTEQELLRPLQVTAIPGVGPATAERLRRVGVHTIGELETVSEAELCRLLGAAHGTLLYALARARDDRPVVADRETKSVSVEDTFEVDLVDPALLSAIVDRMATRVTQRLRDNRLSGRTVTLKLRRHDFSTQTRSATLAGPTDDRRVVTGLALRLLSETDTSDGVRLLGVGVSGLSDWIQDDLFTESEETGIVATDLPADDLPVAGSRVSTPWAPGADVIHTTYGRGWVWGSGRGLVTVRFETAETEPGPVRTFRQDDPELTPSEPTNRHRGCHDDHKVDSPVQGG